MMRNISLAKCLFYMIVAAMLVMILTPTVYFTSLSFFSEREAYAFPQSFIAETSFKLKAENKDGALLLSVFDKKSGEYETILHTVLARDIRRYLARTLSIRLTDEQIEAELMPVLDSPEPIFRTYQKDLLYNYKTFFLVAQKSWSALFNSLKAAGLTIFISLTLGSMAGFAFARYSFKGKDSIMLSLLLVRMFPMVMISISLLLLLYRAGLYDSLIGLAISYSIPNIALTAWITNSIFLGISPDLEEAALTFGASRLRSFLTITLPLAAPGLVASSLYAFLTAWNDTISALILTEENQTYAVAVYKVLSAQVSIQMVAAGSIVLVVPAFIFTFIIKNYIGQMWGEVKL